MSEIFCKIQKLHAGKFYGQIPQQRFIQSSILSEVIHYQEINIREHSHELAYFSLILEGGYLHEFARKSHFYRPMSILWHRDDILHKDQIDKTGVRFFSIEILPGGLENLKEFAGLPYDFIEQSSSLVWLASRLYHEFKNWQVCSDLIAEGITLEMLAYAARKRILGEKHAPIWLLRIVEKLNDEFAENFSTETLAYEAGVHPVYLTTVFRQFYGQTIGEYVRNLRISHASHLLSKSGLSLAEIAALTGFSDQSHFTRTFKRIMGVPPGEFRNSLK